MVGAHHAAPASRKLSGADDARTVVKLARDCNSKIDNWKLHMRMHARMRGGS
jgi:hypothetical protein